MKQYFVFTIFCLYLWISSSLGLLLKFEDLVKSYDNTLLPGSRGHHSSTRRPLTVNVSLLINTLHVDDVRQVIRISGELQTVWFETRLRFSNVNPAYTIGLQGRLGDRIKDYLWLPDLTVANGLHPVAGSTGDFLRVEHDGRMIWTQQILYEFPCKFNLQHYPIGKQKCKLKLQSTGYDNKQLEPRWADLEAVHFRTALVSPRYRVRSIQATGSSAVTIHRTKRQLQAIILLESLMSWPVKQTVLPFVSAVVTAYLSFFINSSGLSARIMLCCTSFIVACIFHISTYSKSPQAPLTMVSLPLEEEGSSALEVFTGTCLTFIWIAIAETVVVHGLSHMDSKSLLTSSQNSLPGEHAEMLGRSSPSRGEIAALWVDRCFRLLYPAVFLAFNAVYWIIYNS